MINLTTRRAGSWSGLALVAASLTAALAIAPQPVRAATVSVAVENYDFSPASRTVTVGDVVRWTFSGDQHSVTSRDGLFDSGIKDPGGTFQYTFTKPGTYRYYCVVHPGLMSGTIVVNAASSTPKPTIRPTARPTPKPTVRPTIKPTPKPTLAASPASTATASPTQPASASPTEAPSPVAAAPSSSDVAVAASGIASPASASPPPAQPAPTSSTDLTPVLALVALLVLVVAGATWLARRRRAI